MQIRINRTLHIVLTEVYKPNRIYFLHSIIMHILFCIDLQFFLYKITSTCSDFCSLNAFSSVVIVDLSVCGPWRNGHRPGFCITSIRPNSVRFVNPLLTYTIGKSNIRALVSRKQESMGEKK